MSGLVPVGIRSHTVAVSALRSVLAAIGNAEAVPSPTTSAAIAQSQYFAGGAEGLAAAEAARRVLTEGEIAGIVRAEIVERETAARQYADTGHADRAVRLLRAAQVIRVALEDAG
jgi:hypothetical protein